MPSTEKKSTPEGNPQEQAHARKSDRKQVQGPTLKTKGIQSMAEEIPVIPIEALFDESLGPNLSSDPRLALHKANVIIGVDVMNQREFLVYGRNTLKRIVASGVAELVPVLRIGLDQDSDELEKLLALVQIIKGQHDYA
jgi:hypothetical protein